MIGHASPEAAEGAVIGLVEEGDRIDIDIPSRTINLRVTAQDLAHRRTAMEARGHDAWRPVNREHHVSQAFSRRLAVLPYSAGADTTKKARVAVATLSATSRARASMV